MIRYLLTIALASLLCFGCSGKKTEMKETPSREVPVSSEPDSRPVIIAFGDSLTAGAGVAENGNFPARLQAKLNAAGYPYRVVNAGASGDTSSQGLDRVSSIIALKPVFVILEFGANDGLRGMPVATIRENLEKIVSRLQSAGAKVIIAGMQVPPNYGPQYTRTFSEIFPAVAKKYSAALIPFFLEGVGGRPELNQDDGIHPTAEGYAIVTENVWNVLQPMLPRITRKNSE